MSIEMDPNDNLNCMVGVVAFRSNAATDPSIVIMPSGMTVGVWLLAPDGCSGAWVGMLRGGEGLGEEALGFVEMATVVFGCVRYGIVGWGTGGPLSCWRVAVFAASRAANGIDTDFTTVTLTDERALPPPAVDGVLALGG